MTTKAKSTSRRSSTAVPKAEAKTVTPISTDEDVLHEDPAIDPAATESDPVTVEELTIHAQAELRKKELIDLAVERSGIKKKDAKPAIEAALAVLGEALAEGREMNLIPFGKLKVTRMKKAGNGQIINARVRQPEEPEISGDDPLAQAAE